MSINTTLPLHQQQLTLGLPGAWTCRPDLIPRDPVAVEIATRRCPRLGLMWDLREVTHKQKPRLCVCSSHQTVFSTRRHAAHPVSVPILPPREMQAVWSHNGAFPPDSVQLRSTLPVGALVLFCLVYFYFILCLCSLCCARCLF